MRPGTQARRARMDATVAWSAPTRSGTTPECSTGCRAAPFVCRTHGPSGPTRTASRLPTMAPRHRAPPPVTSVLADGVPAPRASALWLVGQPHDALGERRRRDQPHPDGRLACVKWPDPFAPDDGMQSEPHLLDQAAACEWFASSPQPQEMKGGQYSQTVLEAR
jgi:hypothetical protein